MACGGLVRPASLGRNGNRVIFGHQILLRAPSCWAMPRSNSSDSSVLLMVSVRVSVTRGRLLSALEAAMIQLFASVARLPPPNV